jgi:hypothetical protein
MSLSTVAANTVIPLAMKLRTTFSTFGIDLPYDEKSLKRHMGDILVYKAFVMVMLVLWLLLSEVSLSSLVTLASGVQCFGFMLLARQAYDQGTMQGISRKMLFTYTAALICRLSSTLFYMGYLPVDKSGQHLYQVLDICTLVVVVALAVSCFVRRYPSVEQDTFWVSPAVVAALVLAAVVHPELNHRPAADGAWMASVWLEAVAFCPQIWMVAHSGRCPSLTSHFVAVSFVARCMMAFFWLEAYPQLKIWKHSYGDGVTTSLYPGYVVVGAYSLQVLVMADFVYAYVKAAAGARGSGNIEL